MVVAVPAVLVSAKVGGVVSPEALVATAMAPAVWLVVKVDARGVAGGVGRPPSRW